MPVHHTNSYIPQTQSKTLNHFSLFPSLPPISHIFPYSNPSPVSLSCLMDYYPSPSSPPLPHPASSSSPSASPPTAPLHSPPPPAPPSPLSVHAATISPPAQP